MHIVLLALHRNPFRNAGAQQKAERWAIREHLHLHLRSALTKMWENAKEAATHYKWN
jgi:hypothetical protein